MKSKRKARLMPAEQHARFVEAAKKAEADERPEQFDKVFKAVASLKTSQKRK